MESQYDEEDQPYQDTPQKMTMKDHDEMVQALKKENFDLKLRLYMTQKNSDDAVGKVSEYEQQIGLVLQNLESQQRLFEQQARELAEAKQKEKLMMKRHRKLESECKQRDEKIQNLSQSLSKLSTSMVDISSPKFYAPSRNTKSVYYSDDEDPYDEDEYDSGIHPMNSTQISRVTPIRREQGSSSASYNEETKLVDNELGSHQNVYEPKSNNTTPIIKHYYNTIEGAPRDGGFDNIGVVKPNNSRTVVDVSFPDQNEKLESSKKKKKKGFLNMFKLCTGKSGQAMAREGSMYHKKEPMPRVTMTTFNDE